jgi:alpha-galactosidase
VGGLTQTEQRAHFSLWVMLSSPLILGNDPRHMSRATLDILTAPEVLAISQDALARQAVKVRLPGAGEWRCSGAGRCKGCGRRSTRRPPPAAPLLQVSEAGGVQVWRKELSSGRVALMALNLNAQAVDVPLVWATHVPELAQKWAAQLAPRPCSSWRMRLPRLLALARPSVHVAPRQERGAGAERRRGGAACVPAGGRVTWWSRGGRRA